MSESTHQQDYWDSNLDIQNLGEMATDPEQVNVEREIKFWSTPDQLWVYQNMGDVDGKLVVDLGGGLSMNCLILARRGAHVVVADISLERLRIMKKIIHRLGLEHKITLVCSTAEELCLKDNSIDIVQTKAVLIHTQLRQALEEIRRVLKSGGTGYFVEPTTGNPLVRAYRRIFAPREWKKITRYFDRDSLETIEEVFPQKQVKYMYLLGFLAFVWQFGIRNLLLFKLTVKALNTIDALLLSIFPFLKSLCWFVIIHIQKK